MTSEEAIERLKETDFGGTLGEAIKKSIEALNNCMMIADVIINEWDEGGASATECFGAILDIINL